MDNKKVLFDVYHEIFDELFDYNDFEMRLKMQKIVYILSNMQLNMGGYSFVWHKFGPYSQTLHDDAYNMGRQLNNTDFTKAALIQFGKVKEILIVNNQGYSLSSWLEALASLIYLHKRMHYNGKELVDELKRKKPHLDNDDLNLLARELLEKLSIIEPLEEE